jgi:N-methylhydantoinase A
VSTGTEWFMGVDIGGTFTDIVLAAASGPLHAHKVRTTAGDPVQAVVAGAATLLEKAGVPGNQVGRVVHGTTLATNLVLEGKGARVAFATTAGFRDLIRIPRNGGATAERADTLVSYVQPESLVPPWMTIEVPERMNAAGVALIPLEEDDARRVAKRLVRLKPESIAICLLHSYTNPLHEVRLAAACQALAPDIPTYISSDIAPSMREYGRAVTTAVSAYVSPAMTGYLSRLAEALGRLGITCPVHIMESSGGVMSLEQASRRAVHTVESGPAAGVISTQALARPLQTDNLLSFDMGGTTAKCGIVRNGTAERKFEFYIGGVASWAGRHAGGFPIRIPVIDLAEIGSGGGSVAWIDPAGVLKVGPRSAGAEPGPACYGLGGEEPTVTDASLLLGYLSPSRFAGGSLPLSTGLAEAAIARHIAEPMGVGTIDAAAAIFELVTADMAAAVRMVTIERGLDPRDFVLVSFGGSGPVHAAEIAATFGIGQVLVPAHAGVRSAVGLLGSDLSTDQVQSCLQSLDDGDVGVVAATYAELESRARRDLDLPERPGPDEAAGRGPVLTRMADVRYRGQAHHLMVPVPDGPVGRETIDEIIHAFLVRYKEVYGINASGPTELVNCRLRAVLSVAKWDLGDRDAAPPRRRRPRPSGQRDAWFEAAGGMVPVATYQWEALRPGDSIDGPSVVDGPDATLVVPPGAVAALDQWGNLIVTARPEGRKSRGGGAGPA